MKKLLIIGTGLLSLGVSQAYAEKQHIDKNMCDLLDRSFKVFSLQEETINWRSSWSHGNCEMRGVVNADKQQMQTYKERLISELNTSD